MLPLSDVDVYARLARCLDDLPAGYPPTESGVELRILRQLFTPEEAAFAVHLTLLGEEPKVIAYRAGMAVEQAASLLAEMEKKGLIYATHKPGKPPEYSIMQFVVGIWEWQVNRLTPELIADFEEYITTAFDPVQWGKAPQLRTIPIGESVQAETAVMPYERAEELVRGQHTFAIANCICRQEQHLLGHGCDKPMETCLMFGSAAHYYINNEKGRAINQEEALQILQTAAEAGLVLQPSNAKEAVVICMCCGCCCGVLRNLKRHPEPASLVASPFRASLDAELCAGCGDCEDRCQMEAVWVEDGTAVLDLRRCIGCGLCVTTCSTGALSLVRKPESEQPFLPKDIVQTNLRVGEARGKLGKRELVGMLVKSRMDRLKAMGS